jgi:ribosome-binding protein aMBF1 (putative translation factor)
MSQKRYDQLRNQVAKRIEAILEKKEWSMSHFSVLLGKSKSHVSSILNADANLTLRVISEMEEILEEKILEVK